ncbi:MAG: bifunctional folylpolyglutamate synthase/dihydrofolate synthase, partial [Candidatus Marinimicrobia bacterium]|nr:bifunctional folylpolyglutamate synthase/dihydrofolate synthase [Candidatus Neomarinimicrobiota bacterium]
GQVGRQETINYQPSTINRIMQDYLSELYKKLSGKMKLGRQRCETLMQGLEHPENSFHSIHIAGTNGKGTVTVVAAALLEAIGLKTGRFTSPHLIHFNERICVDRKQIDDKYIKEFLEDHDQLLQKTQASFFEVTTALGFSYFRDQNVDVAVIETGLGGRLDATSVLTPGVSVITRIGYDHTNILGNTLSEIAREKAGIIKEGVLVLTTVQKPEVIDELLEHTQHLHVVDPETLFTDVKLQSDGMSFRIGSYEQEVHSPVTGRHQLGNIALAMSAVEEFIGRKMGINEIQRGFDLVEWKGRFEKIASNPDIIYDVAHNSESIHAFCKTAKEVYPDKLFYVVLGLLHDKSPEKVLMELGMLADKIWIAPVNSHRSLSNEELDDLADRFPRVKQADNITVACRLACKDLPSNAVLCIVGSHYIAEEVYLWNKSQESRSKI